MSDMRNPIDPSQLSRISEQIDQIDPSELIEQSEVGITPYRIAQIVRAALISLIDPSELSGKISRIDKIAQSQRIYNIARSGRIDGIDRSKLSNPSYKIDPEQAERWIARYVASALQQLKQL